MKLYLAARVKAFTYKNIYNAWKATNLLPYNPTIILKTLPHIEASIDLKIN